MQYAPAFESGGAGLASTIDDYARFATMSRFTGNTKHALLAEKRGDKHVLIGIGHNRKRKEQKKDTKERKKKLWLFL